LFKYVFNFFELFFRAISDAFSQVDLVIQILSVLQPVKRSIIAG